MKFSLLSPKSLAVLVPALGCVGVIVVWFAFFAHPSPPPNNDAQTATNSATNTPPASQTAIPANPAPTPDESPIPNPQSAIRNPQSAIPANATIAALPPETASFQAGSASILQSNTVAAAPQPDESANPQSAIRNPQSPIPTNAPPAVRHFVVDRYEVSGNTLLSDEALRAILDRHTGTNLLAEDIIGAIKELKAEYSARGYDTVDVSFPQQNMVSNTFKIQVSEGKLVEIMVKGNRYFSSNNIMRALPSLKTNIFLNSKIFQPELDRANANQDRQISPVIRAGPETNTSALDLNVKDRFPLHVKLEANNQSSPGTPEMRLNGSAVYNNLWQLNHSLGMQYSFSEEAFKDGNQWEFYDRPLVANVSGFYRLPLSAPESLADAVASHPASFGYNEATRRFELPPDTGTAELNFYASRSTIDTGVTATTPTLVSSSTNGATITQTAESQSITINQALGFRYAQPLADFHSFKSRLQAGFDFKPYQISSFSTNTFGYTLSGFTTNGTAYTSNSTFASPIPASIRSLEYLPLTVRWDVELADKYGSTSLGFNYSANVFYSGGKSNLQAIAGSHKSSGYWQLAGLSAGREFPLQKEWKLALHADGQWASEPLISNEQFGVGGINGVRGFREGEVFGDMGWRITSELKSPPHQIGFVGATKNFPLLVRASAFLDYADTYLLDPNGRPGNTPLCGLGIGGAVSLGPKFEGHLLFAWPILNTPNSESGQLRVSFALSAQY